MENVDRNNLDQKKSQLGVKILENIHKPPESGFANLQNRVSRGKEE